MWGVADSEEGCGHDSEEGCCRLGGGVWTTRTRVADDYRSHSDRVPRARAIQVSAHHHHIPLPCSTNFPSPHQPFPPELPVQHSRHSSQPGRRRPLRWRALPQQQWAGCRAGSGVAGGSAPAPAAAAPFGGRVTAAPERPHGKGRARVCWEKPPPLSTAAPFGATRLKRVGGWYHDRSPSRAGPGRVTELRRGVERQWPRVLGGTPREWGDRKKEADSAEEEHLRVRLRVEAETAPKKVGSRLSIEHLLPLDEILLKLSPVCFVLKRGVFLIPNRGVPRPAPRRGVPLRRRTGEGAGEASERQGVEEACWAPHISAGREVRRKP